MTSFIQAWKEFYSESTIIVNRKSDTNSFAIAIISLSTTLKVDDLNNLKPTTAPKCRITLEIEENEATFKDDNDDILIRRAVEKCGIERKPEPEVTAYWLSFNRDDRELKYGKGYVMEETTYMTWKPEEAEWNDMFNPVNKRYFCIYYVQNGYPMVGCSHSMDNVAKSWDIYPYPLTKNWPYLVTDSASATMSDIANKNYLLSANLPSTCRELYAIVASPTLKLDSHLSDAIKNSLKDCNYLAQKIAKKTKVKVRKDKDSGGMSAYLRINLGNGSDCGSAPRHLELWQPNAGSAIHNHGNAYGVIKVVRGEIEIKIHNKQREFDDESCKRPIVTFTAREGDVTWLSPNWYQTHQLKNNSDEYCATIQCYKYGKDDQIMWPYFDFWQSGSVEEFKREDDMEFDEMCANVLWEYEGLQSKKHEI